MCCCCWCLDCWTGVSCRFFDFVGVEKPLEVHIYKCTAWSGDISESEEMAPRWFDVDKIPYASMWLDDAIWLPWLLEDKCFAGRALFADTETMLEHSICIVDAVDD